jgi:Transport and Golgi organisation 2
MCTVTLVCPTPAGRPRESLLARLICNRDEQRTRAASTPPVLRSLDRRAAVMPIDPLSQGSWIGASDIGLVACLLNATPPERLHDAAPSRTLRSRGEIVPSLLAADSLDEAVAIVRDIDPAAFPPFRAILFANQSIAIARSDGRSFSLSTPGQLIAPLMLTSSGLGDQLVESPRRTLFDRIFAAESNALAAQEAFHTHRWPDQSHLSVLMSRADARTVSRTIVDIYADRIELQHATLNDSLLPEHNASRSLPLTQHPTLAPDEIAA